MGIIRSQVQLLAALTTWSLACGGPPASETPGDPTTRGAAPDPEPVSVTETFRTQPDPGLDLDSVAVWRSDDETWLVTTAKATHTLVVYDATTGEHRHTWSNDLARPNGIVILGDLAFVVERDHHRVHVVRLPGFETVTTFGETDLERPYGVTGFVDNDQYRLWITDNYETPDEQIPPDDELGRRVHAFTLQQGSDVGAVTVVDHRVFGETQGEGVLRKVESIHVDPAHERLLIAEESPPGMALKIYTLDGRYTGRAVGSHLFRYEPEGIALYRCGQSGYWVVVDQDMQANRFLVFDRDSLDHLGTFTGPMTRNTDGIALTDEGSDAFPQGALYAVDDDQAVSAFGWLDIAAGLGLPRCR